MNIIDRQTVIVSVNLVTFKTDAGTHIEVPAIVNLPMNLRFAADEMVLKNITYNSVDGKADTPDVVQIWCSITNDGIIGTFPNAGDTDPANGFPIPLSCQHDDHFRLNNSFQTGNMQLQFQQTRVNVLPSLNYPLGFPGSIGVQPLISALAAQTTFGSVSMTLEFIKLKDKYLYN